MPEFHQTEYLCTLNVFFFFFGGGGGGGQAMIQFTEFLLYINLKNVDPSQHWFWLTLK